VELWDVATGECLDVARGLADVSTFFHASGDSFLRAVAPGDEVLIENVRSGIIVGRYPTTSPKYIATNPTENHWAVTMETHWVLLSMEGRTR
jgi:hypothetical protein